MPLKHKLFTIQEELDGEGSDTYDESNYEEQKWVKENFNDEFDLFRNFFKHVKASRYICELTKESNFEEEKCELHQVIYENYVLENPRPCKIPQVELPNPTISNATRNVKLNYSKEGGRHLVCEKTIKAGYLIISEVPKVLFSPPNCLCIKSPMYQCHHCQKALLLFLPCEYCELCVFCTYECRFDAWMAYHRWECDGIARHYWRFSQEAYLAFRMLMTGIPEKFNVGERDFQNDYNADCHKYGTSNNQYKYLYKLSFSIKKKTKAQLNKILLDATRTLVYLIERTDFFSFIVSRNCFPKLNLYESYIKIGGILVRHECQVMSNVMYLSQFDSSEKFFGISKIYDLSALCITATMINHSCKANAVVILNQNRIIVKALRKIKKGEEITVNYSLDIYNTPMRYSLDCNDFNCSCPLCLLPNSSEYYLAYKCRYCKGRVVKPEFICMKCGKRGNSEKVISAEGKVLVHERLFRLDHNPDHIQKIIDIRSAFLHESNIRIAELLYDLGKCFINKKLCKTIIIFESMNRVYEKSFSVYAPMVLARKLEYCFLVLERLADTQHKLFCDDIELAIQFLRKIKRLVKFYYLSPKEKILKRELKRLQRKLQQ